jgi:UDP-N-acetylglucosamine 3-dehydrogenase
MEDSYKDIRTGVIGIGSMGRNHVRIYNEISNLVAIADPDQAAGQKLANDFEIKWYSDYRDMLNSVDAVSIAVPTTLHKEIAVEVAEARVHMLIEKPIAESPRSAISIIEAAAKSKVVLATGHIERHNPVVRYANNELLKENWGDIITISSKRLSSFPTRIRDVGVVFDLAVHDIDVMKYLARAEVQSVLASGNSSHKNGYIDHAGILLSFSNGIESICEASWLTPMKVRQLFLTTSSHYIELDYMNQSITLSKSNFIKNEAKGMYSSSMEVNTQKLNIPYEEPLKNELSDFLKAICNNSSPLVTGEDGLEIIKIATFCEKSIETNSIVTITETADKKGV